MSPRFQLGSRVTLRGRTSAEVVGVKTTTYVCRESPLCPEVSHEYTVLAYVASEKATLRLHGIPETDLTH